MDKSDSTELARITEAGVVESVVIGGDLSKLTPKQRVAYYKTVCESLGINPFTRPFEYIILNGKLTLYAKKDATDQLRKINGVSISKPEIRLENDLIIVSVSARNKDGREDADIGVVKKGDMRGDTANALMKAVTKAKRRVTLSLCGLGWLDETEVETIPDAIQVEEAEEEFPKGDPVVLAQCPACKKPIDRTVDQCPECHVAGIQNARKARAEEGSKALFGDQAGQSDKPKAEPKLITRPPKVWPPAKIQEVKVWLIEANLVPSNADPKHVLALLDLTPFGPAVAKDELIGWARIYRGHRDEDISTKAAADAATKEWLDGKILIA